MSLRICMPTSEFAPFAKTGGLADVTAGLSAWLRRVGVDVRVFLPFYRSIDLRGAEVHPVDWVRDVPIRMGWREPRFTLFTTRLPDTDQWVYLVDCPELYHRQGYYAKDGDEHVRFGYFSRAVIESCQRMGWAPDVFHLNDWHTALIPVLLRTVYGWDRLFERTRSMLTIHNIGYQGVFSGDALHELGFSDFVSSLHQDDLRAGRLNFMKTGIIYADRITTVSRTYAREILGDEHGMGLQHELGLRTERIAGIVNGVDYGTWNPESDPAIPHHYSADDLGGKEQDKADLLGALGLSYHPEVPVLGVVSRMTWQKGFDLMFEPLPRLLAERDVRLCVLGSGETKYEDFFRRLQATFPKKVCFWHGYNDGLAHRIEAGSDIFLMPSRFEPCGLNQMYSLRYGTVPIVRRTGGLADTVRQWSPATNEGTGFIFDHATPEGFDWALRTALSTWPHREAWRTLMRNGMAEDFSWERQGRHYLMEYAGLAGRLG